MAIDDNEDYTLTGAQVKDLAARIKAGGGGGMTVYVDASFAVPSTITGVFSDSALTTPADPDAMAGIISAGSTVLVVYDGSQSEEVIELSSVNSNSRIPEVGQAFTSTISTNAVFSAPTIVILLYDGNLSTWSVETASVPTKTSDITNDGDDGVHPFLATDDVATVATTGAYSDLSGTPSLATVATSGSYNDLSDKPTIPAAQVQSNWTQTNTAAVDYIKNKPTIPTVNNATLTIQKNGSSVATFTANASSNVTANITVPTVTSSSSQLDVGSWHFWFFSFSNSASGWTTKDLTHPTAFRGKVKHVSCNGLWGNSGDNRLGAWLEYSNNTVLRLRVYQATAGSNAFYGVAIAYY